MTATLRFNLPEETYEHRCSVNGVELNVAVTTIKEQMRSWRKYGSEFQSAHEAIVAIEKFVLEAIDGVYVEG
jgi:hypothetical protein